MSELDERRVDGARNQSLFREVNERIEEIAETSAVPGLTVLCECASRECAELVVLTEEEYESVRRVPTHFLIKPGHQVPEIERVVQQDERFLVVEKFGEGGKLAVSLDRRRRERETSDPRS